MKVSINAIRFINEHEGSAGDPAPKGAKELATRIGAQLGGIEEVIDFGKRFNGVIVARVVTCEPHPNADKLKICKIDDGGKVKGVNRQDGLVQVVCGAPNVKVGMLVAWLPPGATVPETVNKEPFVLTSRDFRGQLSNGMLASARELGLNDDHTGILEIDQHVKPGTSFAEAYHLAGDVILDIENKMFTHRPDCFGWLGIAREVEGISQRRYKSPKWYTTSPKFSGIETEQLKLEVRNELPGLVPRFTAIALRGVKVGPSPVWLQADLARAGMRSINNIVDYTNWYMVLTGQPLHAYDYDKVMAQDPGAKHATLVVRYPKKGETIALLNGKTIEPRAEAIMIATNDKLIGIGGVMGGTDTEVDQNTSNIILEAATFDMYSIRRTAMEHGIFTDAVTRFTKGQSPLQNLAALGKITDQIQKHAHGKVASPVTDVNSLPKAMRERRSVHPPVRVTADFINARLGLRLTKQEISKLLTNVEFEVSMTGTDISVCAPFWRTDIEIPEDVIEEVGRLYGYDKMPNKLPRRDIAPATRNAALDTKNIVRNKLSQAGANELLTYTFVHGDLLEKTGQNLKHAFRLGNAQSPDLQYYRTSLVPSLLDKVHMNIKAGFDGFALFELNKVHYKGEMDAEEPDVPNEDSHVALVLAYDVKNQPQGAPYYQAREYLEQIVDLSSTALQPLADFDVTKDEWGKQLTAPYEPVRSAVIVRDNQVWGVIGEYRQSVRKALKLPDYIAGFEVHMDVVANTGTHYAPLPRFPKVEQDICLRVPADTAYKTVYDFVWHTLARLQPDNSRPSLTIVDIYRRPNDIRHKQITLRYGLSSYERTLTDPEVTKLLDQLAAAALEKLQAQRV